MATNWIAIIVSGGAASDGPFVDINFGSSLPAGFLNATDLILPLSFYTLGSDQWVLMPEPSSAIAQASSVYQGFTWQDRKGDVWVYRGPNSAAEQPWMAMRYYYRTLPGFYFPSLPPNEQPAVGTITPYLRAWSDLNGDYAGDPVNGILGEAGQDNALGIVYHPVWPANVPVLDMAETLTVPTRGLPAIRGQSSLQVLYQQSLVNNGPSSPTVVLEDPTRQKVFVLSSNPTDPNILGQIPASVQTQGYLGRTYFPQLPPHLSQRFFLDPTQGPNGGLIFDGQFVDDPVGDKYVLINVLSASDASYLQNLCPSTDTAHRPLWDAAITNGLVTALQTFIENTNAPGTFIADPTQTTNVGPFGVSAVLNENVAVDSYALTAVGPGVGYVTLVAGNGRAFTKDGDPVSMEIIQVVKDLYPGEIKIVNSSNPLDEKVTLQQVVDLAGQAANFDFDWRIAAPVEGAPPAVYESIVQTLLEPGSTFEHVLFPIPSDAPADIEGLATQQPNRLADDIRGSIIAINAVPFAAASTNGATTGQITFTLAANHVDPLAVGAVVNVSDGLGNQFTGQVSSVDGRTGQFSVSFGTNIVIPNTFIPTNVSEAVIPFTPQAWAFETFESPTATNYTDFWLSLKLGGGLGAKVYLDNAVVAQVNAGGTDTPTALPPGDLATLPLAFSLDPTTLAIGATNGDGTITHHLAIAFFSSAGAGVPQAFDLRVDAHTQLDLTAQLGSQWLTTDQTTYYPDGVRFVMGGKADVRTLSDNYLIMRYRAANTNYASYVADGGWSQWTAPQLVEGWIKRVLSGINPFDQRVTDLLNNSVNTDASILTEAGPRWEGDVALNLDSINNYGLIEIYETVLRRGRLLSIDAGINYGPANDALLLAAGYLSDLYTILGNEAWADANNPTISIGTSDSTFGDIATAMFPFYGETATLLEQQEDELRGRDDFAEPGVQTPPVYNRLYWNYTQGINSGEIIYALNYDIQPAPNNSTGTIGPADAQYMFPQGHGDAYGHYLTATFDYYSLLMSPNFSWVPTPEAVTVLGQPVLVNYMHERKFAQNAAAVARVGKLTFDLAWRGVYIPGQSSGWAHLSQTEVNSADAQNSTKYWAPDHWATRVGQGAYLNWVVINSLLPAVDPDPTHEGIEKVDRTTVPELQELPATADALQNASDNAEGGLNPLGLPENAVSFDINPGLVASTYGGEGHYEQIYDRAVAALNNAVTAFNDATSVTREIRSQQESLADFQSSYNSQELAYTNQLIELYGTPYSDDIGPGQTYPQGYAGPDLIHYMYVDATSLQGTSSIIGDPTTQQTFQIDIQVQNTNVFSALPTTFDFLQNNSSSYGTNNYITYTLGPSGFMGKPSTWVGERSAPGSIQQAVSDILTAYADANQALHNAVNAKLQLDGQAAMFDAQVATNTFIFDVKSGEYATSAAQNIVDYAANVANQASTLTKSAFDQLTSSLQTSIPSSLIFGLADGGDELSPVRGAVDALAGTFNDTIDTASLVAYAAVKAADLAVGQVNSGLDLFTILPAQNNSTYQQEVLQLNTAFNNLSQNIYTVNSKLRALNDAKNRYQSLVAQGNQILQQRQSFRQRAAAIIQGYRTRDAAFRLFQNEKLERYTTLFDLAATYALLAAQAFDYETGLLNTDQGKQFVQKIVSSRALGVVSDGQPQYAASDSGDPGLSSALAEMDADWQVLKGRLGFNNPDGYGTTASLRWENFRIINGPDGDIKWQDVLNNGRMANLLDDADVKRYCLQIDPGNGLPVPGIVVTFQTTIADGYNLFGQALAAGDHAYSESSFATKIFAVGVDFEGYIGMDSPTGGSGAGGPVNDPNGLAATPYIYLIPVGVDSMRSPPLGDTSTIRSWNVADIAVPMPFNIGGSGYSSQPLWQSGDSLSEPLFAIRKHQAFRPVSSDVYFSPDIIGNSGNLLRTQFMNARLIGRSVWNSKWKIVIPGSTLLSDPNDGLDRFIRTVNDIKLYFETYSYSGN